MGLETAGRPDGRQGHGRTPYAGGDFDVLVVGAGPTGLLAACELLRRGVRVRVIDRAKEPMEAPKALSLWPRVRDILDDLGVGDAIRRVSVPVNRFSYFSDRRPLASFSFGEDLAAWQLPQPETERVLTERLHCLGGKVERGVRLLALEDVDSSTRHGPATAKHDLTGAAHGPAGGVTALLEYADGVVERVRAPYVIGADGASSTVRGQLGIGFAGITYEMAFALVDTRIDGYLPPDEVRYYQSPVGTLVVVPQPDGVFRFLSVMPEGCDEVNVPMMQAIVDERGPRGVRLTTPVWLTLFRVHARHATDFQRGRVFLMGDAAHVHSPAGGQGMNNGLQDAHNLGWRLAAVIHGQSPESLLLSYGTERSAATRRIVRDTDLHTRAWVVNGPLKLARDAAFRTLDRTGMGARFYAPVLAGRRLAYPPVRDSQQPSRWSPCRLRGRLPGGLTVGAVFPRRLAARYGMSGPDADPVRWIIAVRAPEDDRAWLTEVGHIAASRPLVRLVRLAGHRGDRPEAVCARAGFYLVRPDGHIAAHGHDRDLARLEAELDNVLLPAGEQSTDGTIAVAPPVLDI